MASNRPKVAEKYFYRNILTEPFKISTAHATSIENYSTLVTMETGEAIMPYNPTKNIEIKECFVNVSNHEAFCIIKTFNENESKLSVNQPVNEPFVHKTTIE